MKSKQPLVLLVLLAAVSAPALGQASAAEPAQAVLLCPEEECHFGPVFRGQGGLVGRRAASHVDEEGMPLPVTVSVTCGPTTVIRDFEPDAEGSLRLALNKDNGFACAGNVGSIEIHGLEDGGWYWINDDRNSAVAMLLPSTVKLADQVWPVDPGGVKVFSAGLGTYVKDEESGRVGILPHHLPTRELAPCPGGAIEDERCRVGGPGDWRLVLTTGPFDVSVGPYDVVTRGDGVTVRAHLVPRGHIQYGAIRAVERISSGLRDGYLQQAPLGLDVLHTPFLDAVEGAVWAWQINVSLTVNGSLVNRCAANNVDRLRAQYVVFEAGGLQGASPAFTFENGPSTSFWVRCPSRSSASAAEGAGGGGPLPVE